MTEAVYHIAVTTKDEYLAGTDSDVSIQITGSKTYPSGNNISSVWLKLDTPWHDDFEAGHTDEFDFTMEDIGSPIKLEIEIQKPSGLQDSGGYDWLLDQIVITYGDQSYLFPYRSWITHGKTDDPTRSYISTLYPVPGGSHRYRILTKTGNSGTDGDVRIRLHGLGTTPFVLLDTEGYNDFEPGKWSYYEVDLPDVGLPNALDLGQLTYEHESLKLDWVQVFYGGQTAVFKDVTRILRQGDKQVSASPSPIQSKSAEDKPWELVELYLKNLAVGLLGEMGPVGTAFGAMLFTNIITEEMARTGGSDSLAQFREVIEEALIRQDIRDAVSIIRAVRDRFNNYADDRQLPGSRRKLTDMLLPNERDLGLAISKLMDPDISPHALAEFMDAALLHLYMVQELATVDPDHYSEPRASAWYRRIRNLAEEYQKHIKDTTSTIVSNRVSKIGPVSYNSDEMKTTFNDAGLSGDMDNLDWNYLTGAGWYFQNMEWDGDKDIATQYVDSNGLHFKLEGNGSLLYSFHNTYFDSIKDNLKGRLKQASDNALKTLDQLETSPLPDGIPIYPIGFDEYQVIGSEALLDIALRYYGSVKEWPHIQRWNRSFAPDPLALVASFEKVISVPRQVEDLGNIDRWVAVQEDEDAKVVKRSVISAKHGYAIDFSDTNLTDFNIKVVNPDMISINKEVMGFWVGVCLVPPDKMPDEAFAVSVLRNVGELWVTQRLVFTDRAQDERIAIPGMEQFTCIQVLNLSPAAETNIQYKFFVFWYGQSASKKFLFFTNLNYGQVEKFYPFIKRFSLLNPIPLAIGALARVRTVPVNGKMDYLRLRDVPGLNGVENIQNRLPNGEIVTVIDGPQKVNDVAWWQIKRKDGNTGWVAEYDRNDKVLTLVRTHNINPHHAGVNALIHTTLDKTGKPVNLNLRSQPGTKANIIANLPNGEIVKIIGGPQEAEGYVWWQLERADGKQGWSIEYTPGDTVHILTLYDLRLGLKAYVNTLRDQRGIPLHLNIRSSAGKDAAIIHKLDNGDRVLLIAGPQDADGFVWWKVRCADGTEGWAAAYLPGDFTHTLIGLHDT